MKQSMEVGGKAIIKWLIFENYYLCFYHFYLKLWIFIYLFLKLMECLHCEFCFK